MANENVLLKVESGMVAISAVRIEGTLCVVVDCADYDAFRKLPAIVSLNGEKVGKSGWNSDKGVAYYQSSAIMLAIE